MRSPRETALGPIADGLSAGTGEGADVMYEPGNKESVFALNAAAPRR
jgi:hypothetical protein